jgi:hypothetical protein
MRLVRDQADVQDELPETTWRRLREYQILVPSEPGGDSYLLAEPVARLLTYLQNNANPATPEIIRGYVQSLDTLAKQLASCRLVSRQTVKDETGVEPSSGAVHYLLFKLVDLSSVTPRDVTALVLKANQAGKGGRFPTFQTHLKEVMHQKLASQSPSSPATPAAE